ncbi:hypothetical protein [Priestia megaterium]|uniref:hypothetical protein n=1 Tax=Priestia megaterium TaxID=1404 RepID=UPI000472E999|nr:hypothetical protein [Priestia megaterium]
MVFKDGNKEFQFGGSGDVFLGTLAIGAVTFLTYHAVNVGKSVLEKLVGRDDLPEVIEKSTNVVKLEEFRQKLKRKK